MFCRKLGAVGTSYEDLPTVKKNNNYVSLKKF